MNNRLKINLKGLLQGIGFRPFVYRLAKQYQQAGWVANDNQHVVIEIEGDREQQALFLTALQQQVPACGHIAEIHQQQIPTREETTFQLKTSLSLDTQKSAFVCPDIAVCDACIAELFDPTNRRYGHPFISCCHCGSRYSLMHSLPYDRCNTSLRVFPLCPACLAEYQDPSNRRFHAQTIACHDCGSELSFSDNQGHVLQSKNAALAATIEQLKNGKIVAVKGVGGFQLMVDATNQDAVLRLRQRKHRMSKPFALMVKSVVEAEQLCELDKIEKQLLQSAAAPIVLVKAKQDLSGLINSVAPNQALLGLMLPYTPIQHLIMHALQTPLIATSANQQGEPICIDNQQAIEKLAGIADFFLCHNRDILRPLDDSIVRVIAGKPTVLRRARGYVPTPIALKNSIPATLAVGGHTKNTVAIAQDQQVILSQHLGDLEQLETGQQFEKTITDLSDFYHFKPQTVARDLHSDYFSSQYAQRLSVPVQTVQHHYAHILSCMAEHQLEPPVLGVAWDGTGLGTDNQLWGGEFLLITAEGFQRVAHCRPFPLIGAFQAIKEPRRVALALLYGCFGDDLFTEKHADLLIHFSQSELKFLHSMLKKSLNCPQTTSIGRLFDGVASLLGLCQISEFEGQAAMALEQAAMFEVYSGSYSLEFMTASLSRTGSHVVEIDWQPLILSILEDLTRLTTAQIAAKFHHTLAKIVFAVAERRPSRFLKPGRSEMLPLVLSGGCFQNAYLVEAIEKESLKYDYPLFRHEKVPPNDGGLALGQIYHQSEFDS
jgi:hydrogenase maturation protein HypF